MRVMITGASGFVGRHLSSHLRNSGDEVLSLGDRERVDVCDPSSVMTAVQNSEPEVIYHLAAQSNVGASWSDPARTARTNIEGTINVLEAARNTGGPRVIVISSAEVYGIVTPDEVPLTESSSVRPASPYGASKSAAETFAFMAARTRDQDVVVVRPFNHLGPGQSTQFVTPALAARVAENEVSGGEIVTVGNLDARRDLTDVRDVVRAYRLLAESGRAGEVYNVCSGRAIAIKELADRLLASAHTPMRLEPDPALLRPSDVPILLGDASLLSQCTGWAPEIPIEQTLEDILAEARVAAGDSNNPSRSTNQ